MTKEDVINKLEEKKQEYLALQEKAFNEKTKNILIFVQEWQMHLIYH